MHLHQQHFSKLFLFKLIVLFTTSTFLHAQKNRNQIDTLLNIYSEHELFSGAVLIAHQGEVVYKNSFGFAHKTQQQINRTDTKFKIASLSKQFTATLILQLANEGKLDLHSPILNYLPDFPKERGKQITTHHLLTHTSGLPNYTSFQNYKGTMHQAKSPEQLIALFADSSLQFSPGTKFSYSNSGYVLLGKIIENLNQQSYEEVLQKRIFEPLNMNSSGYAQKTHAKEAKGYWMNGGDFEEAKFIDMSVAFSAGGIHSTVEDLYLWDQALYTEQLLPNKYLDTLFGKHIEAWNGYYGYGWANKDLQLGSSSNKIHTIQHSGIINGFSSLIVRIPSSKSTIILLDNSSSYSLEKIAQSVAGILHNEKYDLPKKSTAYALYKRIKAGKLAGDSSFFKEIKENKNYYLDENEMNLVGHNLLRQKQFADALYIFEVNVKTYHQSSSAYNNYGEALLITGDTAKAILQYEKSLELNPKNQSTSFILEKLGVNLDFLKRLKTGLFSTEETWRKEIFPLPVGFASKIKYRGVEEARFAAGWADNKSEEFWTYLFGWYIETNQALQKKEIEQNLQFYFDGLMSVINRDKGEIPVKTTTDLKQEDKEESFTTYKGNVSFYDAFFTKKAILLNLQVEQKFCQKKNKSMIVFRFSPKEFNNKIWSTLMRIVPYKDICLE